MRNYILSEKETLSNQPIYTVADLSNAVKRAIESNFDFVRVRGEISKPASPGSGHIYFSLKDHNVTLACVIWKGQLSHINIQPEEGMDVICSGKLTTFSGQSRYQLNVIQIEYSGEGSLLKQFLNENPSMHSVQSGGNATSGFKIGSADTAAYMSVQSKSVSNGGSTSNAAFQAWLGASNTFRVNANGLIKTNAGIDFSGAQTNYSGMSSEVLDSYEEGTFTPSINGMGSISYSLQAGKYTKIGNVVYWHLKIQVSNITGNRNQAFGISGFPHNITNSQAQVSGNFYGETWDGEIPTTLKYFGNVNRGQLYYYSDTMKYFSSSMLDININSSMLMGSGFYYTN